MALRRTVQGAGTVQYDFRAHRIFSPDMLIEQFDKMTRRSHYVRPQA